MTKLIEWYEEQVPVKCLLKVVRESSDTVLSDHATTDDLRRACEAAGLKVCGCEGGDWEAAYRGANIDREELRAEIDRLQRCVLEGANMTAVEQAAAVHGCGDEWATVSAYTSHLEAALEQSEQARDVLAEQLAEASCRRRLPAPMVAQGQPDVLNAENKRLLDEVGWLQELIAESLPHLGVHWGANNSERPPPCETLPLAAKRTNNETVRQQAEVQRLQNEVERLLDDAHAKIESLEHQHKEDMAWKQRSEQAECECDHQVSLMEVNSTRIAKLEQALRDADRELALTSPTTTVRARRAIKEVLGR